MRIGVIGLGRRMAGMLKQFRKIDHGMTLAGVVDTNPENVRHALPSELSADIRFFDSLDEMIQKAKPDALAIGTRCDSHSDLAIQAAPYGFPIFLEKPIAVSMDQAIAVESAFRRYPCPVLVSFPLRTSALCLRAKQTLLRGVTGSIEHILAVNYVAYGQVYFDSWFRDYSVTQGLFLQKATHDFDYLAYLVGSPITRVAAMSSVGRVYRDACTKEEHSDPHAIYLSNIGTPETGMNEDSSSALLEFSSGAKGVYTQVFYSKRTPRRGAVLSGSKGMLEFDWYKNAMTTVHHQEPFTDVSKSDGSDEHFGGDQELARNFISMVQDRTESAAPLSAGLASVYACLAAKKSAETGRFMEVRQVEPSHSIVQPG